MLQKVIAKGQRLKASGQQHILLLAIATDASGMQYRDKSLRYLRAASFFENLTFSFVFSVLIFAFWTVSFVLSKTLFEKNKRNYQTC